MLKSFTGFKGTAARVEIGKIQFWIIAKDARNLEALWNDILSSAGPFDPGMTAKCILIEASILPEPKRANPNPINEQTDSTQI